MFRVEYDVPANLLSISVRGFLKPEDAAVLASAIDAKAREAHAIRDDFNVIVESLEFPVQATDVAELLTEIMRRGIVLTSGHVAVIVGSQLNKLQAERTLVHPRVQIVSSMDAAQFWLDQGTR